MILIKKVEFFLFQTPVWKLILFLFLIMFFKVGLFYHPNLWYHLEVARNPYNNIFIDRPELQSFYLSYFGSWLAYFVGATSKTSFFLLHLLFSIFYSFLFIRLIFKNFSNETSRIALILFFIFPASSTVYYIVGYDSVTIFLMTLGLYFRRYILLTFLIGILMGLQHFELSFFGSGGLLFAMILATLVNEKKWRSILFPLSLFIGVIFGRIILHFIFDFNNIEITNDRTEWYLEALPQTLYTFFFRSYDVIWFSIGLGWLILIKYYLVIEKKIYFFLPFFCMILMLTIIPDTTRTFSVMSFLIISYFILLDKNFLNFLSRKEISFIFFLWAIIPYGWAWQGIARPSHFPYTVGYTLKHFVDWFDKSNIDASNVWPFFYPF